MRCLFILMSIGCVSLLCAASAKAADTGNKAVYSVRALWDAFEKDPNEALRLYAGKDIIVEGYVVASGPSVYMTPKVELSDSENGQSYAACILPRSDFFRLPSFTKGKKVRLAGNCRGLTFDGTMVLLKECVAVQ